MLPHLELLPFSQFTHDTKTYTISQPSIFYPHNCSFFLASSLNSVFFLFNLSLWIASVCIFFCFFFVDSALLNENENVFVYKKKKVRMCFRIFQRNMVMMCRFFLFALKMLSKQTPVTNFKFSTLFFSNSHSKIQQQQQSLVGIC